MKAAMAPVTCKINIREPVATPTAEPVATPTAEPVATPTAEPVAMPIAEPVAAPTAKPPVPSKGRTGGDAATSSGTQLRRSQRQAGRKLPAMLPPQPADINAASIPPMVIRRTTVTIPAVPLEPPAN